MTQGHRAAISTTDDSLGEAIIALQSSNVYIKPGLSGTDGDTANYIQSFLHGDDHIVIVMLGQSPLAEDAVAQGILESLGGKTTIGLYANGHTSAYSTQLPSSAVNEAMADAQAISMNPRETLATFVRLTHQYQLSHPEAIETTTTTGVSNDDSSIGAPLVIGGGASILIGAVLAIALFSHRRKKRKQNNGKPDEPLAYVPRQVQAQLARITQFISTVKDTSVTEKLQQIVHDTEVFFQRSTRSSERNTEKEAEDFETKLKESVALLEGYVDIQNSPRYWDNPEALLSSGKDSIDTLSGVILQSVKDRNTERVLQYRVSNDLLTQKRR